MSLGTRLVWTYPYQRAEGIDIYSDTDWSGCPRTRKSTSGGVVMVGSRCIRTWSSTQPSVTLSSGKAEFYGIVKASGAGLGHQSLLKDLGLDMPLCVWADSSATLGTPTSYPVTTHSRASQSQRLRFTISACYLICTASATSRRCF